MADLPHTDLAAPAESAAELPALKGLIHAGRAGWRRISWHKIALFGFSLFLFVLAITLMKEGAYGLGPLFRDRFAVSSPANSLGFGWLFAYVIMSGSPVAAAALAFLDAGIIDEANSFTMITGSRLGASLIVLLIGFIFVLRGRSRSTSLDMGLLCLAATGSTYLAGMIIGLGILKTGLLNNIQPVSGTLLISITDLIFDPILNALVGVLPRWSLFLVGLIVIIVSFSLFDKCLPQMTLKESQFGQMSRLIYRPWVMFLLGAAITLISMSVSVSLAILVPLSQRGFVRRENVIPYIMGANITTFIDTLFAAVLLGNPAAFTVVLTSMICITVVSILILATIYRRYEHMLLLFVAWIVGSKRNLVFFMVSILLIPVILILI